MVEKITLNKAKIPSLVLLIILLLTKTAQAGKLSIVIDDIGYQPNTDNAVMQMPVAIAVAILPNAPHARLIAEKAHNQGREVLIHMPMAPLSKQPQERDTLQPSMSSQEIARLIHNAIDLVPYAVGMNNHMGSAMTADLPGMQAVMQTLANHHFYFLDSRTTVDTQAEYAAVGTGVTVIRRKVFLDDTANPNDIRQQFNRAINLARRNGSAIAIGHPRPATITVLQQMLATLPSDIVLVKPSSLLNEPQEENQYQNAFPYPPIAFTGAIKQCAVKLPKKEKVESNDLLHEIQTSLAKLPIVQLIEHYWKHQSRS